MRMSLAAAASRRRHPWRATAHARRRGANWDRRSASGSRFHATDQTGACADPAIGDGPTRRDARVHPVRGLVTLLQDAARGAARTHRRSREAGLGVAAISYDPPETLAAFARAQQISFPLLSDAGSATIRRYGILNPLPELALAGADDPALKADLQRYVSVSVRRAAFMAGMAFPGTFIVDRQGRVTSRFFEEYVRRTEHGLERDAQARDGGRVGQRAEALDGAPGRHRVSE